MSEVHGVISPPLPPPLLTNRIEQCFVLKNKETKENKS